MRATLSFKLPEELEAFDAARAGHEWKAVVDEYDQFLRNKLKYEEHPKAVVEALAMARKQLNLIVVERGLASRD